MSRIEGEVGRMRLLVKDLLLLARLDEERPLEPRPVDLLEVAADAVRDAHARVPDRFVRLAALDDGQATFEPVTVPGDEAGLRQVVTNLVTNALQHTPDDARSTCGWAVRSALPEHPAARVAPAARSARSCRRRRARRDPLAVIEVSDTGPGCAPADAARVFERLYRADSSRSRTPRRRRAGPVHRGRDRARRTAAGSSCGPRPGEGATLPRAAAGGRAGFPGLASEVAPR